MQCSILWCMPKHNYISALFKYQLIIRPMWDKINKFCMFLKNEIFTRPIKTAENLCSYMSWKRGGLSKSELELGHGKIQKLKIWKWAHNILLTPRNSVSENKMTLRLKSRTACVSKCSLVQRCLQNQKHQHTS